MNNNDNITLITIVNIDNLRIAKIMIIVIEFDGWQQKA